MNNSTSSPPPNKSPSKAANRSKWKRSGFGCAVVLVLLVVGLATVGVIFGPRLLDSLAGPTASAPLALNDRTSPEELAARRQQEIARLNGYGWVDKEAGVAHIPIVRAITLVAESGLPVSSGPAAATGESQNEEAEAPAAPAVDLANVNFQDDVLPIFEQHCAECHGDEKAEEGLILIRYRTVMVGSQNGPVVEPGDVENSYLVEMVVSGKMPKEGDPLTPAEIETITAWIEAGAPEN